MKCDKVTVVIRSCKTYNESPLDQMIVEILNIYIVCILVMSWEAGVGLD